MRYEDGRYARCFFVIALGDLDPPKLVRRTVDGLFSE
jgi:hypothetical protein